MAGMTKENDLSALEETDQKLSEFIAVVGNGKTHLSEKWNPRFI